MSVVRVPLHLPDWLVPPLRRIKRSILDKDVDLRGDRDVEWSFIAGHLPTGPGRALDFGCNGTYLSLIAARRGLKVVALDLEDQIQLWRHDNREFVCGDLLEVRFPESTFDVVINCSSVEHVGLAGRYSVSASLSDGDLDAMKKLYYLMKPGGIQLLTIPLGRDTVFQPWHRVYGEKRLPMLLNGYDVVHQEFWRKDRDQLWKTCEMDEAMKFNAAWDDKRRIYALGCFVLRRLTKD
ncbi:MAG: DUF268 domain-containing protein [Candidatus Sulfotelmatobacter sp.]